MTEEPQKRPSPYPLKLWELEGVSVTCDSGGNVRCDLCFFPIGNADNSLRLLIEGSIWHAQRHAAPPMPRPAYLGDTPTPAGGWFAPQAPSAYQQPDVFLVVAHGGTSVHHEPHAAVEAAVPDGYVIGPVPTFANFNEPAPAAVVERSLALVPAPAGPFTSAELTTGHGIEPALTGQLVDELPDGPQVYEAMREGILDRETQPVRHKVVCPICNEETYALSADEAAEIKRAHNAVMHGVRTA